MGKMNREESSWVAEIEYEKMGEKFLFESQVSSRMEGNRLC